MKWLSSVVTSPLYLICEKEGSRYRPTYRLQLESLVNKCVYVKLISFHPICSLHHPLKGEGGVGHSLLHS